MKRKITIFLCLALICALVIAQSRRFSQSNRLERGKQAVVNLKKSRVLVRHHKNYVKILFKRKAGVQPINVVGKYLEQNKDEKKWVFTLRKGERLTYLAWKDMPQSYQILIKTPYGNIRAKKHSKLKIHIGSIDIENGGGPLGLDGVTGDQVDLDFDSGAGGMDFNVGSNDDFSMTFGNVGSTDINGNPDPNGGGDGPGDGDGDGPGDGDGDGPGDGDGDGPGGFEGFDDGPPRGGDPFQNDTLFQEDNNNNNNNNNNQEGEEGESEVPEEDFRGQDDPTGPPFGSF